MAGHEISQVVELDADDLWRIISSIIQMTVKELKTDHGFLVKNQPFIESLMAGTAKYDRATLARIKRLLEKLDNWSLGRGWILGNNGNYEHLCDFCNVNIENQRAELRPFMQLKYGTLQIRQAAEKHIEDRHVRIHGRKRARTFREAARRMVDQVGAFGEGLSRSNASRFRRANSLRGAEETGDRHGPERATGGSASDAAEAGLPGGDAEDPGRSGGVL